jgi:hypothetical protein
MRGYPLFNFPAFLNAARYLRSEGFEVWNPAEADLDSDGWRVMVDPGSVKPIGHYIKRDIAAIVEQDAIVVLPGWDKSAGALSECFVGAMWNKLPIYRCDTFEPVTREELAFALASRMAEVKDNDPL